jgi:hypothetical protein
LHGKTHQDIGAVVARLELFLQTGLRDLAWRCGRQILPMHQMGETTSSSELLCCFQWCRTMPGTADLAGQSRPAMFWPGHRRRPHRQRLEMMRFRGSADARSAQGSPTRSRATAGRGNPPSSQACNPSCQRGLSDVRPSLLTSEQIRRRRARTKGTAIRPGDGNSARLSARGIKQGPHLLAEQHPGHCESPRQGHTSTKYGSRIEPDLGLASPFSSEPVHEGGNGKVALAGGADQLPVDFIARYRARPKSGTAVAQPWVHRSTGRTGETPNT